MDTQELVRLGAEARLALLDAERAELLALLGKSAPAPTTNGGEPKRKRTMSPAARRAIGRRMKAYWKLRNAQK